MATDSPLVRGWSVNLFKVEYEQVPDSMEPLSSISLGLSLSLPSHSEWRLKQKGNTIRSPVSQGGGWREYRCGASSISVTDGPGPAASRVLRAGAMSGSEVRRREGMVTPVVVGIAGAALASIQEHGDSFHFLGQNSDVKYYTSRLRKCLFLRRHQYVSSKPSPGVHHPSVVSARMTLSNQPCPAELTSAHHEKIRPGSLGLAIGGDRKGRTVHVAFLPWDLQGSGGAKKAPGASWL